MKSNGAELEKYVPDDGPPPPYVIQETMRYVAAHVADSFNIKDLAAHLRCHPDFLSRKFKQHTGVDLSVYIRRLRIGHASELLKKAGAGIDDVAEKAGFSDRIHFTKVFRRVTGQTPGQFQRQFRAVAEKGGVVASPRLRSKNPRSATGS